MCTLGAVTGRFLFKTRDLWGESDPFEEIVSRQGRLCYLGLRGQAAPGERGLNSGINEAGVAVAVTFADTVSLADALAKKTPRGVLVEEILGRCSDLASALRTAAEFQQLPLVGGNIVIMTPQGGAVIEELYPWYCVEQTVAPVTVRTNHFINLREPAPLKGDREGGLARHRRMVSLLSDGADVDARQLQAFLADHAGAHPICSHAGELTTVSAVIYDLEGRRLNYAPGPPCRTAWQEYRL
ncbi:carcinine hydrolase/isopenicillin-N N-acyltransferase family protein [Geomesophilobacter sediminis]|uniref:Peptidase C45 hydrolase domain-containing protein n=1 Tax=Geomesophilobacter sediminis TaxID=2798584 RepID=A0A8J7JL03_9BACT|nr:carcinine hydrolase/isopenicillin-N N-acyltransferase family protein [Geomesophilobacter sediminis]MBJ6724370.1 hypothetical protein [Geomesophilobacter sediminis]